MKKTQYKSIVLLVMSLFSVCFPLLAARNSYADSASNLILNPSAETLSAAGTPNNWTPDTWGTSSTTLSTTSDAENGAVALTITTASRTSGDAKWMPDAVAVTAGQTYTFSDYSKATVPTEIDAVYTDASGNKAYYYLATVPASTSWQQNTASLTVPAGEVQASVLHILPTAGTLTTDNYSLIAQSAPTPPPPPASGNLIADPSFQTANGNQPAGWTTGGWGTNDASFSYVTNDGHGDSTSAKVQINTYTDGDAKWYFTPVAVQASTAYTFSDYSKASAGTSVVVRLDNGSGTYTYLTGASPAAAINWTQTSFNFTTLSDTKYVTVFHLLAGVGTLQIDDVSLTAASVTTGSGNLMPNPKLQTASGTKPASWTTGGWGTNNAAFTYLTTKGHGDKTSARVRITTYQNGSAYWHTTTPQQITGGQTYEFSDYYQSNVATGIDATVTMADGSQQDMHLGDAAASPGSWSNFSVEFTAPAGAASIMIYHSLAAVGNLVTDDFSLTAFSYQGFNRAMVSITDDDGFANFYTNGLPILQSYNLPATAYIISGYLGATDYMTAQQVVNLSKAGIEIGSHTVDHPDLTTLTASQQQAELQNSQTTLQSLLGLPVPDFASPYGTYNDQVIGLASKYYQSYRTTDTGYNARNNFDPMRLLVQNVTNITTTADVQSWLQEAAATHTWLILVYHQISADPSSGEYSASPANFDAQMSAVKNSGIAVETISQALAEVRPQL